MKNLRKLDLLLAFAGCAVLLLPVFTTGAVYALLTSCLLLTLLVKPMVAVEIRERSTR